MKYLKRFFENRNTATLEDMENDIIELNDVMSDIADEYDIYEIPYNRNSVYILKPEKGIHYKFSISGNRIFLEISIYTVDKQKAKELITVGMQRFYNYLDSNNYKYSNANMKWQEFFTNISKPIGVSMTIWQIDY